MECAAIDGRSSAVHSHGALHAPLCAADSELKRRGKRTIVTRGRGLSMIKDEESENAG